MSLTGAIGGHLNLSVHVGGPAQIQIIIYANIKAPVGINFHWCNTTHKTPIVCSRMTYYEYNTIINYEIYDKYKIHNLY